MKKIYFALITSALFTMAVTSCKKSQDLSPALNSSNASNSAPAINDSATLTYNDSGVCAMIHGLQSQHNTNYNGFPSFKLPYGHTMA